MLFQIIYNYIVVLWVWFQCYTGEGIKIHKNDMIKKTESRGVSNNIMDKADAILTCDRALFYTCIV